jgi:ankyrin repeat protein
MLACFGGHLFIADYLREHGALLDSKDLGGSNALHWAIDGDKKEVVKWILGCGMNVSTSKIIITGYTCLLAHCFVCYFVTG